MPTIDAQIRTRHEGAGVADQKHGGTAVLFGLAEFVQHVLCRPFAASFWVLYEQGFDHCCYNVAWRDGVDADSVGTPFAGQVAA